MIEATNAINQANYSIVSPSAVLSSKVSYKANGNSSQRKRVADNIAHTASVSPWRIHIVVVDRFLQRWRVNVSLTKHWEPL